MESPDEVFRVEELLELEERLLRDSEIYNVYLETMAMKTLTSRRKNLKHLRLPKRVYLSQLYRSIRL